MKLVSNQYMLMLNRHFEKLGREPMRKKTFMRMMAMLTPRAQRHIARQFDGAERRADREVILYD